MYTVWITATRSVSMLPLGALAALLPPAQRSTEGPSDLGELVRRSSAELLQLAGGRRLGLFVDDAHLLDDLSAALVSQLVTRGQAFFVGTMRTGAPAPDTLVSLWKDEVVERIDLGGLSDFEVETVVSRVLDGPVDASTAASLAQRARGNLLFLHELIVSAQEQGALRPDSGIWRLAFEFAPSDRLVELIRARMGALDQAERTVMEAVAYGEPLGSAELGSFGDRNVIERLEEKGLLSLAYDGRRLQIRAAHPLYADVVRLELSALREQRVALALAEAVDAFGRRRREDTLRVGTWRLVCGGADPGVMYEAARTARWRYAFPLAERLARESVAAGAGFDARLLLAQLAGLQGRTREAIDALDALGREARDDASRAQVVLARIDAAVSGVEIERAISFAEEAERAVVDPAWRDEIAARRAMLIFAVRGFRDAADAAAPLIARAAGRPLVVASIPGAYALTRLGRITEALEVAKRGYEVHAVLDEPFEWHPSVHLVARCVALATAGRFVEADALATEQRRQAVIEGAGETRAFFAALPSLFVADRGNVAEAELGALEAAARFRQEGRPTFELVVLVRLAITYALGGRLDDVSKLMKAIDSMEPVPTFLTVEVAEARAWAAAAAGDIPTAQQLLENGAAAGESIDDRVGEQVALHTLARFGAVSSAVERLAAVTRSVEGELSASRADHVRSLADRDAPGLEIVSTTFERLGATLLAAEAAADAAVIWRRAGDTRRTSAAELRAATLTTRCGAVRTPALASVAGRARLTPTEYETAQLAAAGRSNREIADAQFVSIRTVENRLQRVYDKLGVAGRSQLADALRGTV